jgi:hypothetical protein
MQQVVAWKPLGTSAVQDSDGAWRLQIKRVTGQLLAIQCKCNHVFFHGARGRGSTEAQLMAYRRYVGAGYGSHWRGVVFDREYKNLDDLVAKSHRLFNGRGDGAEFLASRSDYKWRWPTGEELMIRQIKKEADYWLYHGQEFPFIGWNELPKYPTPSLYDAMGSCNRSGFTSAEHYACTGVMLPSIPLHTFATGNPFGPGHTWVKKRFIDAAPAGKITYTTTLVFNPQTQKREPVTTSQVAIFGSWRENEHLDPQYVAGLERMTDKDKQKAWRDGNWNILGGGSYAVGDLWKQSVHVRPRFRVPAGCRVYRALDWGTTKPFSAGWWMKANGEDIKMLDGSVWCPQPNSLVRIAEWYGSEDIGTNVGLRLTGGAAGRGIAEREKALLANGWISSPVWAGPADNNIFHTGDNLAADSIAKQMEAEGVTWTRANKSPGSRKLGLDLLRTRLENSLRGEGPGLYYTDNCRAAITLNPTLPRDEEKTDEVDTECEDHLHDEERYMVLDSGDLLTTTIDIQFAR